MECILDKPEANSTKEKLCFGLTKRVGIKSHSQLGQFDLYFLCQKLRGA